jgi:ElaB/YqjD/DUF883 family membrane-anchored ribosome-binding protein
MSTAFQKSAFQNNAYQIEEAEDLKGRIVRRGKFKVWDKDPWDLPEKQIVEVTAAEIESLLEQKDYLKTELSEAKGANLRAERNRLNGQLKTLNKQIERVKQQLVKQKQEYVKAEQLAIKQRQEAVVLQNRQDDEFVQVIMQVLMELYDD